MTDEMFYFYHIAHMAKHFEIGGCGIRPFIDLWILDKLSFDNHSQRDTLLNEGGLLQFANVARRLSKAWLEGKEMDPVAEQMQDYILRGGVYGNVENRVAVQQQKKGGRIQYMLSRIFLPYDVIKFLFPVLQRHRWLTPVMEVARWGKIIFDGRMKRSMRELGYNKNISKEESDSISQFLKNIGL